jgi:hypothetical protein
MVKVADCKEEMVWLDCDFEGFWEVWQRGSEGERGDSIAGRV